jgi:hypothetical protein
VSRVLMIVFDEKVEEMGEDIQLFAVVVAADWL